jgi:hypothetical protein
MGNTIKFTISVPAGEFKELEARRREEGKTRSQFVREAVQALKGREPERPIAAPAAAAGVKEDSARYGAPDNALPELTDMAERHRRAVAAAGRFRSGVADLSTAHDRYLEDGFAAGEGSEPISGPDAGEKS